jgi:hypothetical protein
VCCCPCDEWMSLNSFNIKKTFMLIKNLYITSDRN